MLKPRADCWRTYRAGPLRCRSARTPVRCTRKRSANEGGRVARPWNSILDHNGPQHVMDQMVQICIARHGLQQYRWQHSGSQIRHPVCCGAIWCGASKATSNVARDRQYNKATSNAARESSQLRVNAMMRSTSNAITQQSQSNATVAVVQMHPSHRHGTELIRDSPSLLSVPSAPSPCSPGRRSQRPLTCRSWRDWKGKQSVREGRSSAGMSCVYNKQQQQTARLIVSLHKDAVDPAGV